MTKFTNAFTNHAKIEVPVICGAMYPCSNPELVGSVSAAGGLGIVQPVSLTFVHKRKFRDGLKEIKIIAKGKPIGLNLLIEKSSKAYLEKNKQWMEEALQEGVRFFVTALGDPSWVTALAKKHGAIVYHDVTERKWAQKAFDCGVDGFICVNRDAGGHAGTHSAKELFAELKDFGIPLICAGGVGEHSKFIEALDIGYQGVQMGTRFIASVECTAHDDYKNAILRARAQDIVLTKKLTGVPVSVIKNEAVDRQGTEFNWITKKLAASPWAKHYVRMYYTIASLWRMRRSFQKGDLQGKSQRDYFQAGKSVDGIQSIDSVATIIANFANAIDKSPYESINSSIGANKI